MQDQSSLSFLMGEPDLTVTVTAMGFVGSKQSPDRHACFSVSDIAGDPPDEQVAGDLVSALENLSDKEDLYGWEQDGGVITIYETENNGRLFGVAYDGEGHVNVIPFVRQLLGHNSEELLRAYWETIRP